MRDNAIVIYGYKLGDEVGTPSEKWFVYSAETFYQAAKRLEDTIEIDFDITVLRSPTYPAFHARRTDANDPWRLYHNNQYVTILDNIIY